MRRQSPQPRQHHFLPQCYLSAFSRSGEADGTIWVLDKQERRQFASTPAKVARIRDYYRVEGEGADPFAVEAGLSQLESGLAPILRRLRTERRVTDLQSYETLMEFLALLVSRVPRMRKHCARLGENLYQEMRAAADENPERFLKQWRRVCSEYGRKLPDDLDPEEVMDYVLSDEWPRRIPQNTQVYLVFHVAIRLFPVLMARKWNIVRVVKRSAQFVCSDSPVTIARRVGDRFVESGFGLPDTQVAVPIDHKLALLGTFEGEVGPVITLDRWGPVINTRSIRCADRFVYSRHRDFRWADDSGKVQSAEALLG